MSEKKKDVFEIICPHCQASIWVEAASRTVLKAEKAVRKKESLDELLVKEQERRAAFDQKFEAAAELAKKKKEKAREKFEKAFEEADED
jgi:hypothetical protein